MARRDELMDEISQILSIPAAVKGVGSSVHNDFIDPLTVAVLGEELAGVFHDKYRRIEAVITALGGEYLPADPGRRGVGHTSEGTRSGGGGTLTNHGLETIRDLLLINGVPSLEWDEDVAPQDEVAQGFTPEEILDKRIRRLASVATRPGAQAFRSEVLSAYGSSCCISRYAVGAVLEAAHICPYRGPDSDRVANALLLRADLHKLHDARLLAVSDEDHTVLIKDMLKDSPYGDLEGVAITEPTGTGLSDAALRFHRDRCGL